MKKLCLILLVAWVLALQAAHAVAFTPPQVQTLTEKFQTSLKLEQESFQRLKFTASEKKLHQSLSFKLILKDQRGQEWLFKDTATDGSVAIYKLYTLLGLPTPEIFPFEFTLNKTVVKGSLQRFIPNSHDFDGKYGSLSAANLNYLLYSHLISWIGLNHHVHKDQFIVDDKNIYRIDNSVSFTLLGNDSLDVSYVSPMLNHMRFAGYVEFWNTFFYGSPRYLQNEIYAEKKSIKLDFKGALVRALFIQSLPDQTFLDFFRPCIESHFSSCGNNIYFSNVKLYPYGFLQFDEKNFAKNLLKRKNSAYKDLLAFYQKIEKAYGENLDLKLTPKDIAAFTQSLSDYFDQKNAQFKQNLATMPKRSATEPITILADTDYSAYKTIHYLVKYNSVEDGNATLALAVIAHARNHMAKTRSMNFANGKIMAENLDVLEAYIKKNGYARKKIWPIVVNTTKFFEKDYVKKALEKSAPIPEEN